MFFRSHKITCINEGFNNSFFLNKLSIQFRVSTQNFYVERPLNLDLQIRKLQQKYPKLAIQDSRTEINSCKTVNF